MTQYVIADNVNTQLATAASNTATTLTLASAANLPTLTTGQIMPLTLNDAATGGFYEIVYVTAISGVTLTVERAQEGTGALNWSLGDYAYCAPTAGTVATALGNPSNLFAVAAAAASNQAVNLGQFASSLGANGYTKLPNGLIIQWLNGVSASSGIMTQAWPITFPNNVLSANCTYVANGAALAVTVATMSTNTTNSTCVVNVATGSGTAVVSANVKVIAVGY